MDGADDGVRVRIGTSADAPRASEIADMVNMAYGRERTTAWEISSRLRGGDRPRGGRILHVAERDGRFVGCASSTPEWDASCGQWGFLAVAVTDQRTGVATALVCAAEARLAGHGCRQVQIEYTYRPCSRDGPRLHAWYRRLGFRPTPSTCCCTLSLCLCTSLAHCEPSIFMICRKPLGQPPPADAMTRD